MDRKGMAWIVAEWNGVVRKGEGRFGEVWCGKEGCGLVRLGEEYNCAF